MRLLYTATLLSAFGVCEASAADNGEKLFQMFENTCAAKPVSGAALDARAQGLGYVHQNGPAAPDDPERDPDDIHFWKLPGEGSNFAIDAYFAGRRTNYRIVCGLHADNVDVAALISRFMRETSLPEPRENKDSEAGRRSFTWNAQADGGKDILAVAAYKNGRVSVTFSYDVIAR